MTAKILDFNKKSNFEEVVEEMLEFNRQGLVTDVVLTYRRSYSEDEEQPETGVMCRYWFGETSSIFCLGLWANMRHIIERYINGEDLIDG